MSTAELQDEAAALVYYGELGHVSDWKAWRRRLTELRSALADVAADRAQLSLFADWEDTPLDLGGFISDSVTPLRELVDRADEVLAARRERCGLSPAAAVPAWAAS